MVQAELSRRASRLLPAIRSHLLQRCPDAAAINSWLCLLRCTGLLMAISIIFDWGWEPGKVLVQQSECALKVWGARAVYPLPPGRYHQEKLHHGRGPGTG